MTRWTGGYVDAWRGASPDLRRFLVATAGWNAFFSVFWVNFGPYVLAIGIVPAELGLITAAISLAGAIAALPAGLLADTVGRRPVLVVGQATVTLSLLGLALARDPLVVALLAAGIGAGTASFFVVGPPFLSERTEPIHRDRFFAAYFAIGLAMGATAPILLAPLASGLVAVLGDRSTVGSYRLLVVLMAVVSAVTLLLFATLREPGAPRAGRTSRSIDPRRILPMPPSRRAFVFILLMSGLVALGAGQLIPFLNVFVQRRFSLDLVALNVIFAAANLGTLLATLAQPWLASRLGRVRAIVALQLSSLPFILVLGWAAWLPLVTVALVVRNMLMNAGNPLYQRFAMDQVPASERARLSGGMQVMWSAAWVAGAVFYGAVQGGLGFDRGYAVNFAVTLGLYALASLILWRSFGGQDARPRWAATEAEVVYPAEGAEPTLLR